MNRKFNEKRQKGQFFTKNSDYILQGLEKFIKNKQISDPFAGGSDLISWAKRHGAKQVIGYEIDYKLIDNKVIFANDSINNLRQYEFIITNPPYLHKNKASIDTKEKYFTGKNRHFEDLYQISINAIMNSDEGILIVPLNFLSADNSRKIRNIFFDKFEIVKLNIFHEQVFEDTTYNVISFYYRKRKSRDDENLIFRKIIPEKIEDEIIIKRNHAWKMGGEFASRINKVKNNLGIYRLTEDMLIPGDEKVILAFNNISDKDKREYNLNGKFVELLNNNIILLRAIDSKNNKKIQLEDIRNYGVKALVGKQTSRNMAYLIFGKPISVRQQKEAITLFNKKLNNIRRDEGSFFLTNFRDNNRKRISFEFVYKMINYICEKEFNTSENLARKIQQTTFLDSPTYL